MIFSPIEINKDAWMNYVDEIMKTRTYQLDFQQDEIIELPSSLQRRSPQQWSKTNVCVWLLCIGMDESMGGTTTDVYASSFEHADVGGTKFC